MSPPTPHPSKPAAADNDLANCYIVRFHMTSGQGIAKRTVQGEYSERLKYVHPRDIRRAIATIRATTRQKLHRIGVPFYQLQLINEEDKEFFENLAESARERLQKVHQSQTAEVFFLPLNVGPGRDPKLYQRLYDAVRARFLDIILERVRELAKVGKLPSRSRTALLNLCDKAHTYNILKDPRIDQEIDSIKRQLESEVLTPVLEDIERRFKSIKNVGSFLEIPAEA